MLLKLKCVFLVCFATLSLAGFSQTSATYRTQGMSTPGFCMDSATLDIENDGDLDIVSGHRGGNEAGDDTLTVYVNDGNMHYSQTYYVSDIPNNAVCTGDFNNDGFGDIASACWNNSIRINYNDGLGGFDNVVTVSSTRGGSILKSIDIEGDGDLDLFYLSNNPNFGDYFGFYMNHGTGFHNYLHTEQGVTEDYTSLNDMDGDGVIDVISGTRIFLNAGNHFDIVDVPFANWAPTTSTGDYDNDGDADILILNGTFPLSLYVLENQGNMTFEPRPDIAVLPGGIYSISPMVTGDLNGDGYVDFIYMEMVDAPILTDMYLHIAISNAGQGYETQSLYFNRLETIFWFNLMEIADLDLDGNNDIILSSVMPNDVSDFLWYMMFIKNLGDGVFEHYVESEDPIVSHESRIPGLEIYPNPFVLSSAGGLDITLSKTQDPASGGTASIRVFNIRGQVIRTLPFDPGLRTTWDGCDEHGARVPSGIYIVSYAQGNGKSIARKITILE